MMDCDHEFKKTWDRTGMYAISLCHKCMIREPSPINESVEKGNQNAIEFAKRFCETHKDLLKRMADK